MGANDHEVLPDRCRARRGYDTVSDGKGRLLCVPLAVDPVQVQDIEGDEGDGFGFSVHGLDQGGKVEARLDDIAERLTSDYDPSMLQ